MLRTGQFYQLWLMFVLSASAGLLIIGNITLIAQDQAPKWDKGFVLVMVVAIFNTCGRFLSGFVSDRIGRTNTMVLAFVLQAVNMFMFVQYRTPALLLFGSAFTGLCYGTIFTLFPAATADFYGVRNLGVNYGSAVHRLRGRWRHRVGPWRPGARPVRVLYLCVHHLRRHAPGRRRAGACSCARRKPNPFAVAPSGPARTVRSGKAEAAR